MFRIESGRGVTANMLVLGTSDSGFESRRPDSVLNNEINNYKEFFRKFGKLSWPIRAVTQGFNPDALTELGRFYFQRIVQKSTCLSWIW
mgnify:CR=1 FL=1